MAQIYGFHAGKHISPIDPVGLKCGKGMLSFNRLIISAEVGGPLTSPRTMPYPRRGPHSIFNLVLEEELVFATKLRRESTNLVVICTDLVVMH